MVEFKQRDVVRWDKDGELYTVINPNAPHDFAHGHPSQRVFLVEVHSQFEIDGEFVQKVIDQSELEFVSHV